jgi:hypothetical protein
MPIRFSIVENNLKPGEKRYRAQVKKAGTLKLADIIREMTYPGSGISPGEAIGVLTRYHETIIEKLKEGYNIVLPVANFGVGIRGGFRGTDDHFYPKRHKVVPYTEAGSELLSELRFEKATKIPYNKAQPSLHSFYNLTLGASNSTISPNCVCKLTGKRLKFNVDDEKQGVFLNHQSTGKEYRISLFMQIRPSELLFQLPSSLPEGNFMLVLRTILPHTNEIRSDGLSQFLSLSI